MTLSTMKLTTALFTLLLAAPASATDLFVGSPNTLIAQASPPTGSLTTISACGGSVAGLAAEGGELFAAATFGLIYRYRQDSQQVQGWATVPGETLVGLALRGHEVLVATASSQVIALDRSRGTELRRWTTPFPITTVFADRGEVFAGTNFGAVMRLEDDLTIGFLGTCGSTILSIAASDTELFLGSTGGIVWRVDRATGFVTSSFPVIGDPTGLACDQFSLFVGTESGTIYTYAVANGALITSRTWGSPVSAVVLGAPSAGTTYCFSSASACPCGASDWQGPFGGCPSILGIGARLITYGCASVSGDDLELAVLDLPPTTLGRFYMGGAPAQIPFGNGLLCAGSGGYGQFRFPAQPALLATSSHGAFRFGPGIAAHSQQFFGGLGVIQPGSTWRFQAWFRDVQNPCGGGFNTSNATSVTFQP